MSSVIVEPPWPVSSMAKSPLTPAIPDSDTSNVVSQFCPTNELPQGLRTMKSPVAAS